MTIYDLTDDDSQRKLNNNKQPVHRPKDKKEQLSEQDLIELMGLNRDRYQRVNGRVKRK